MSNTPEKSCITMMIRKEDSPNYNYTILLTDDLFETSKEGADGKKLRHCYEGLVNYLRDEYFIDVHFIGLRQIRIRISQPLHPSTVFMTMYAKLQKVLAKDGYSICVETAIDDDPHVRTGCAIDPTLDQLEKEVLEPMFDAIKSNHN